MVAPTPVNAYLDAATTVKAGVFLMARVLLANPVLPPTMPAIMLAAAVFSMSVALFFYFFQDDLKRLLAYSTMAHLGYVLVGVGLGAYGVSLGFQGAALHIITHGASKALLFFCAGAIAYATGVRSISRLSGLGSRMPLTATAFFIGLAAVTGIPPFACFWSKFYLFSAALQLGGWAGGLLLAFLLLESMISFGFLLWVGGRIFLGEPSPAAAEAREVPFAMRAGLVLSILFCLAAPFVGMAFTHLIVR
jgi:hydrogenase-4 component D